MNNIPYLHYEKDQKSLVKAYYIALIPILLFGFYKNGIMLYQNNYVSFGDALIPLYFYFISAVVGFLVAFITKEKRSQIIFYALLISCSVSINTNMFLYPVLLFVGLFVSLYLAHKWQIHTLSLTRIILILALFLGTYSYLNVSEKIGAFNYDLWDLFFGYGSGGIATTSFLFLLFSFLILLFNPFYKKWIPLSASASFAILFFLLFPFTKDAYYLESILNGTVYFGFVFVATDFYVTPSSKKGMIIYGLLIGLLSAILGIFIPIYEISYISIFLVSFIIPLIDRFCYQKYLHS